MRIVLCTGKGDKVLMETDIVEEAEKILREYTAKGCAALTEDAEDALAVLDKMPKEILIFWPMAGG